MHEGLSSILKSVNIIEEKKYLSIKNFKILFLTHQIYTCENHILWRKKLYNLVNIIT